MFILILGIGPNGIEFLGGEGKDVSKDVSKETPHNPPPPSPPSPHQPIVVSSSANDDLFQPYRTPLG